RSLFTSARPFLDLNRSGTVNSADADIAIQRIANMVREHYAPYDLEVRVGDHDDPPGVLSDSQTGDVVVFISGGYDFVSTTGAYGWAPVDPGNHFDDIAWIFGRPHADAFPSADRFLTQVAVSISHETGHTFGLQHIVDDGSEAALHHIMFDGVGDAS